MSRRLWDRVERAFEGGRSFGIDWPTLRATYPNTARVMKRINEEWRSRNLKKEI